VTELAEIGAVPNIGQLRSTAAKVRREVLKAVANAKGGHVGGPLSAADILVALYFSVLNVRPDDPTWGQRDRFILSKGHSAIALYAVLALRGYFPLAELRTFDATDSRLQGHPDMMLLPGIDMSTGSLGLGFSAGIGVALGAKLSSQTFETFVMVGDGECNEGVIWEGAHVAQRYELDNLTVVVDHNGLQQFGWRGTVSGTRSRPYGYGELAQRWKAFGWRVLQVDGHDISALIRVLAEARGRHGVPSVVIAETVKGKGVSFMENNYVWHSRVPTEDELNKAMSELGEAEQGASAPGP